MGYPPQGPGISKKGVEEIIGEWQRKARKWKIISIILAIIAIVENLLLFAR